MKTLTFTKPHDLAQLNDELLTIPELTPNGAPKMAVEGKGDEIAIRVADDADETAITSIVNAHTPVPRVPPDFKTLVGAIAAVDFEGATTLAALRTACIQLRNRTALALRSRWGVKE